MTQAIFSPQKNISDVLMEYRQSIFRGFKFFFNDFVDMKDYNMFTQGEREQMAEIKDATVGLVFELGGNLATNKIAATHIVHFKKEYLGGKGYRAQQKVVHYTYILECFFKMMKLKTNEDDADPSLSYEVRVVSK